MNVVKCPNADCPEYGVEKVMELTYTDPEGDEVMVSVVFCGSCGTRIEDIEEAPDA
jgi:C4-type Zn-finger protein